MNESATNFGLHPLSRAVVSLGVASIVLLAGCGNVRPVINTIGVVGPAGQPTKYAVAVSNQSTAANPNAAGLVSIVDFSGDNVVVTSKIGVNPQYFILDSSGSNGFTINGDHTVNSFPLTIGSTSSPGLEPQNVTQTTLLSGANPVSISPEGANTYIAEPGRQAVAQLTQALPLTFQQEFSNVGQNPVYVVGINGAPRAYSLAQGANPGTSVGQAAAIETTTNTISALLPVGIQPVYGVMTADGRRAFIMNKGSNTVSVINAQTNALDTPILPNPIPVGVAPVWADFATTRTELVVANQGNGTTPGSVSIISIPLCSVAATSSNPLCNTSNPIDASGFGTVLATVPVGINPVMVSVLSDGTRAYVANAGIPASGSNPGVPGSVSVVNLNTNTVTSTIPVAGHPVYIASTYGNPTGKVYVVSSDSHLMTIIDTDTDKVNSTVDLQGNGVSVRVTAN